MGLSARVLLDIDEEAHRALTKHGRHSIHHPDSSVLERLAALTEEVGEVAKALTYDGGGGLRDELIQLAASAAGWAQHLPEDPI